MPATSTTIPLGWHAMANFRVRVFFSACGIQCAGDFTTGTVVELVLHESGLALKQSEKHANERGGHSSRGGAQMCVKCGVFVGMIQSRMAEVTSKRNLCLDSAPCPTSDLDSLVE